MAVDDIAVLRIVGNYQEQNIVNTMHYQITTQTGPEAEQWQELVDEWVSVYQSDWLDRHVDAYELIGVKAFTVKGATSPPGEKTVGTPGSVVGDPELAFVCRTITFYSDSPNPRRRGRLMLSGGAELMFSASKGSVTGAEVVLLTALGTNLLDPLTAGNNGYAPVIYEKLPETISNLIVAKGRTTPSTIRSRRIRRFLVG